MKTNRHVLALAVVAALSSQLAFGAEKAVLRQDDNETYGQTVGRKLSSGMANLIGAPLELPKNVILTINDSNFVVGSVGGLISGIMHLGARVCIGMADLITAPIPTDTMVAPLMVWDDMGVVNTYGPILKGKNTDHHKAQ